jgi:spore coat polysaccharide biosynthesis protein SpsF
VQKFEDDNVDYCANTVPPETSKFPDGSDIEVFSMNALEMANTEVKDKHHKEHVTFQFWQDEKYVSSQYTQEKDWSEYRITVDYPEDFEVVEYIFKELNSKKIFGSLNEIIGIIENNKEVKEKNSQYFFGQGWDK